MVCRFDMTFKDAWRFGVSWHNTCNKAAEQQNNNKRIQPLISSINMSSLHSWKLERWCPSSLEHPINKHPVFPQASEIEFPGATAVFSCGEYFEVSPGDEARVSHANIHWALRGVPANGHRPFLHQIFEFSALQPGYRRPRHHAYHRHLLWQSFGVVRQAQTWSFKFEVGAKFRVLSKGNPIYTVENLARNVPGRGQSGSDPPPRRRESRTSIDQSNAAKRTEVLRQTTIWTNRKQAWVDKCMMFTNDNNIKNSS